MEGIENTREEKSQRKVKVGGGKERHEEAKKEGKV